MTSIKQDSPRVDEFDNTTLRGSTIMEKPTAQVVHEEADYRGGQNIGRRLTDESLHVDHPINISRLRKNLILLTLAWSGFLANYSASE
jgi:hypothetical protein